VKIKFLQLICLFCIASLFSAMGVFRFLIDGPDSRLAQLTLFLVQVAPLLVFIPGLLRLKPNACVYLALTSLLYFTYGVAQVVDPRSLWFGIGEIVAAIGLCTCASLLARSLRESAANTS